MTNMRQRSQITHTSIGHSPFHGCFLLDTLNGNKRAKRELRTAHSIKTPEPLKSTLGCDYQKMASDRTPHQYSSWLLADQRVALLCGNYAMLIRSQQKH